MPLNQLNGKPMYPTNGSYQAQTFTDVCTYLQTNSDTLQETLSIQIKASLIGNKCA